MTVSIKSDPNLRVLRAISEGARSLSDLKRVLRKDARAAVAALRKDGSVGQVGGMLTLTKRGAGRLRFAS